jgi:hypothetical protein
MTMTGPLRRIFRVPATMRHVIFLAAVALALTLILASSSSSSLEPASRIVKDVSVMEVHIHKEGFFDCDRPESLCRFFQPKLFWQEGGLGEPFGKDYERLGGANKNLPACTALEWSRSLLLPVNNSTASNTSTHTSAYDYSYLPRRLSFVHMHKCGGTTIIASLFDISHKLEASSSASSSSFRAKTRSYRYSFGGAVGSTKRKETNSKSRQDHVDTIKTASSSLPSSQMDYFPVFCLVRDPVERFLSAVQQVMHYNDELRSSCLKTTAKATIQCAIRDIASTQYRRDVHLLPMATHLRLFDQEDIKVSVFSMTEHLPYILRYLNQAPSKHIRDRSKVKYATSKILATMSVKDCNEQMRNDICELYAVDVAMMKSLGFETKYCAT